jgi:hypothetical protein
VGVLGVGMASIDDCTLGIMAWAGSIDFSWGKGALVFIVSARPRPGLPSAIHPSIHPCQLPNIKHTHAPMGSTT